MLLGVRHALVGDVIVRGDVRMKKAAARAAACTAG
jgi:hypothetical protein